MELSNLGLKKISFVTSILLMSSIALTSCSSRDLTSEAYRFGKETGTKWRELTAEVDALSQWANEESGQVVEIPEVEKESACKAMWLLVGWPKFGFKNISENRTDFVDGCLTTIGS